MMKATAVAPANIAFIKYWGKADEELRLPLNDSISMNMSEAYTITTVDFSVTYAKDEARVIPIPLTIISRPLYGYQPTKKLLEAEKFRIRTHLDRIRQRAKISLRACVETCNNFPKGSGIASSASGFAALTEAGFAAAGIKLSEKELSIFARLGSGSACRSIPDGFVEWVAGDSNETSYAYSLYAHDYWDLRDILLIVSQTEKKVSSTAGMEQMKTSLLWHKRIEAIPQRIVRLKRALKTKDFSSLGDVIEEDCLDMHHVMQTQSPPLLYWSEKTKEIMEAVRAWRKKGLLVYFTIDAGPNVHLLCEAKDEKAVMEKAKNIPGVLEIIFNKPARGAHIINEHLF